MNFVDYFYLNNSYISQIKHYHYSSISYLISCLLFSVKNPKWKGYHVNPFKATELRSPALNEPILYDYHNNDLFQFDTINIVFAKDLPVELKTNKYCKIVN